MFDEINGHSHGPSHVTLYSHLTLRCSNQAVTAIHGSSTNRLNKVSGWSLSVAVWGTQMMYSNCFLYILLAVPALEMFPMVTAICPQAGLLNEKLQNLSTTLSALNPGLDCVFSIIDEQCPCFGKWWNILCVTSIIIIKRYICRRVWQNAFSQMCPIQWCPSVRSCS